LASSAQFTVLEPERLFAMPGSDNWLISRMTDGLAWISLTSGTRP
jgi:hypothetical protein